MPQGKWNITIETPVGQRSGVLHLTVVGSRLTGYLSDEEYLIEIKDGRIEGNQLEWSAKLTKPMRLTCKFTATVQGDRIEGMAKYLLGSAVFFGRRA